MSSVDARLLVVSCPGREAIVEIWQRVQRANWPDCPFPIDVLSPAEDIGWNANLIRYLSRIDESFVLLMLDDHFPDESAPETPSEYTLNMYAVIQLMTNQPDIAMVKLQAGNAWPPEIPFPANDRLREYDRKHHPFKRTNLVPTMFRREWLLRLATAVLHACGPDKDKGRDGAICFEVEGTRLTEDAVAWPEKMLGIHRPNPDGGGGRSLLPCIDNDGVREGKLKAREQLTRICGDLNAIQGIEAFL